MIIHLRPFGRVRFLVGGLVACAVFALFLGWSVTVSQGIGVFVVFVVVLAALARWAVPSDRVRTLELTPDRLVLRRASPTVTSIAREQIVGAHLEHRPGAGVLVLDLTPDAVADHPDLLALDRVTGNRVRLPLAPADAALAELDALVERVA